MGALSPHFRQAVLDRARLLDQGSGLSVNNTPFNGDSFSILNSIARAISNPGGLLSGADNPLSDIQTTEVMHPILECDFKMRILPEDSTNASAGTFGVVNDNGQIVPESTSGVFVPGVFELNSDVDWLMTDVSGGDSGVDWSNESKLIGIPVPSVQHTAFTLSVIVPSSLSQLGGAANGYFRTLWQLYERQFNPSTGLPIAPKFGRCRVEVFLIRERRNYLGDSVDEEIPLFTLRRCAISTPTFRFKPSSMNSSIIDTKFTYRNVEWADLRFGPITIKPTNHHSQVGIDSESTFQEIIPQNYTP